MAIKVQNVRKPRKKTIDGKIFSGVPDPLKWKFEGVAVATLFFENPDKRYAVDLILKPNENKAYEKQKTINGDGDDIVDIDDFELEFGADKDNYIVVTMRNGSSDDVRATLTFAFPGAGVEDQKYLFDLKKSDFEYTAIPVDLPETTAEKIK